MFQQPAKRNFTRRSALAGIGASGAVLAGYAGRALAAETSAVIDESGPAACVARYSTVGELKASPALRDGTLVDTAGFHAPGDGGGALYRVRNLDEDTRPNGADVIALDNGLAAVLVEGEAVNYKMFGAVGDGRHDDGVEIKLAHQYAGKHRIPIVNPSGEFWIKRTHNIPITTNVHWGQTTFHIDERYNSKRHAHFAVLNDQPSQTLALDEETKAALLERIKPGVQIIPELAAYAGHLISVVDANDRIGIRAGARYSKAGWAREELFYVEEEGRMVGDIAWEFKDFTSATAIPCNDNYLVIEGGGFYVSGDTPEDGSRGYHMLGISVERSRTIIRQQWVGLEPGKRDVSLEPRGGFYRFDRVYDVILENIRAMPWEKTRPKPAESVEHGTYGISGARMLNCTFRNLTAEAGPVAWGVFGTNLNKNFRVENCRLNRIDVHFHCWNLYVSNCTLGFKGITVTGGGDLFVENTVRHGNSFISFRQDYGAKWDGRIRLRGCTLKPGGNHTVSVLACRPGNFNHQYPVGFGRSVTIEDLVIDYSAAPKSTSACWLMDVAPFSKTDDGARLFFAHRVEFRNIRVEGRARGVRLIRVPDPYGYELPNEFVYDGSRMKPNCAVICDGVQLEALTPRTADDAQEVHLLLGGKTAVGYADSQALCPKIRFSDCENVSLYLGNCIAGALLERCTVNMVTAPGLKGELVFSDCRFQPDVIEAPAVFYTVESTLGTRFTNCTIHAPIVAGKSDPEMVNRTGFLEINGAVRHYHLNTALGNEVVNHIRSQGMEFSPDFIAKLRSHHALQAPGASS